MTGNQALTDKETTTEHDSEEPQLLPDVPALMDRIRQQVKATIERAPDPRRPFKPFVADDGMAGDTKAGKLLYSEDLRFLNAHHATGVILNPDSVVSHRKGLVGKVVVKLKRKVRAIVWDLLKDYIASEREFQGHLIRYLNDVSKYVDARDAANFWEIIRKIDVDVAKALERIERIQDDVRAELERFGSRLPHLDEERLSLLIEDIGKQRHTLETLDTVVRGLEGIVSRFPVAKSLPIASAALPTGDASDTGYSYLLLENRFRGSEDTITGRVRGYLDHFRESDRPILEIGSGRGEFLSLCKERGLRCYGVDIDKAMVEAARSKGHEVQLGDGIAHLRALPDRSLSGLIAIQVVEHLPRQTLEELCRLAATKVLPGKKIIFETINPQSLLALSSNYFRDPTHVWPLHPDTLQYTMELAGLTRCKVEYRSPVPTEAQLQKLSHLEFLSPKGSATVEQLNRVIEQLNKLLYGFQEYCIVAEAPQTNG